MYVTELYSGPSKQIKVIYPGRFQPPHKGHAKVYEYLCQKFGTDNVYIVTSDKTEMPKSPFNFAEKAKMWALTGVNTDRVIMDPQPYQAKGLVANFDAKNTILLFAVSEKDMAEDPRFQFKPKKDGSPSYFQPFTNIKQCETLDKHAYMMTVPTFDFTVLGKPANSATQIRKQFAEADLATQRQIVTDLFGKFDNNVFNIMKARLEVGEVTEDIVTEGNDQGRAMSKLSALIKSVDGNVKYIGPDHGDIRYDYSIPVDAVNEFFKLLDTAGYVRTRCTEKYGRQCQDFDSWFNQPNWNLRLLAIRGRDEKCVGTIRQEPMKNKGKVAEGEEDDIAANIQATTGRSPEEARRIMQAARKRALQMHKGNDKSLGFDARFKTNAAQLAVAPKGKEGFITGESAEINELSPATHASHAEKRSPQIIPTLMKDVKKGAKMGRAVGKSLEKVKAAQSNKPNIFTESEVTKSDLLDPDPKIRALATAVVKMKKELHTLTGSEVTESEEGNNPQDVVSLDIPLLIRMLEYAREDAKTDMDLHNVVEKLIQMSADGKTLSMSEYNSIVTPELQESIEVFKKQLNESEADSNDILEKLTDSYQSIVRSDMYGQNGKDRIKTVYELLRDPLMKGDMNEFSKMWEYCAGKWPDEFDELASDAARLYVGDEVVEGAKVDRMVGHIKKSEKKLGKSDREAENIAWATANKRGMLDNKNKKTEAIVPGFGEMRPEQVSKEVEALVGEMLQYARDGNMGAVAEYIRKLQPFVETAKKAEITESIDRALRTAKRNASY